MNKFLFYKLSVLFSLAFLMHFFAPAQTLPANQPEQDACTALKICGNFTTPYSYVGEGYKLDLTNTPCGYPEQNSVWLRLEVNTAGIIVFEIQPFDPQDDYDFAIVDITGGDCNNIQMAQVIRCNFNNNQQPNTFYANGIIGLNTTSTTNFVPGGAFGQPFLQQINAAAGDVYLIMINNFGHDDCFGTCPGSGFTIDFTGSTATFNQPDPPSLKEVLSKNCDKSDSITIKINEYALCKSIAIDGSDFYLTPTGKIKRAYGIGCVGYLGYTDSITIVFDGKLSNGDYELHAQKGTDRNTLVNFCDAALRLPDKLRFHVGDDPIQLKSIDWPACQELTLRLDWPVMCSTIAADGSDFFVKGPSTVTVQSATGVGCTAGGPTDVIKVRLTQPIAADGNYYLVVKKGSDNNTLIDNCQRVVMASDSLFFEIHSYDGRLKAYPKDTFVCPGKILLFTKNSAVAPANGFRYNWSPASKLDNSTGQSTRAMIDTGINTFIVSSIDSFGCYIRDSIIAHGFPKPYADFDFRVAMGCKGDTVIFEDKSYDARKYYWDFGHQRMSDSVKNPIHFYPDPGTYFVSLIVKNQYCSDSLLRLVSLGHPLSADFTVSDDTICQGETVKFTNNSIVAATNSSMQQYQWNFADLSSSNLKDPSYTYKRAGVYKVELIVGDSIPCYDTAIHYIVVDSLSPIFVSVSDTPICQGESVAFWADYSSGGLVYSAWNFGDGIDSSVNVNPIRHAFDKAGKHTVAVMNHYRACPDTIAMVDVRVKPMPYINLGPDTSLCLQGDPIRIGDLLNKNSPKAEWLWNTGETASFIEVKQPGHYRAKVTLDNCSTNDEIWIHKDCYIDIPNTFTPNGDGVNDYFFPRSLNEGITSFYLAVYNRWGQKIFETANLSGSGWDGRFNGKEQPVGVYVYQIKASFKNGKEESYTGNVTLLR